MHNHTPILLIILDGWGIGPDGPGNAVALAKTPFLDKLIQEYPHTELLCAGKAVGLPDGIMGNSEVGHLNIGAGRIVNQDQLRIDMAIQDGTFHRNSVLTSVMSKVRARQATLHLMGLLSDGGVHSQLRHLFTLIDMADRMELEKVSIHAILDGRDTPPNSGVHYLSRLKEYLDSKNIGFIATVCGRYFAMDRDNRWDRVEKAYRLYTKAEGIEADDPVEAVKKAYLRNEFDEFIRPIVIRSNHTRASQTIKNGDGVVFYNFRADRAREITRAFTDPEFEFFTRNPRPVLCDYVCMTRYDETFSLPVVFPPVHLDGILGEIVSKNGLKQLRIAETEKYAHVTYFFNGGEEKPFPLEDRCLIPSPKEIPTYDLKPEMSALAVTEEVLTRIRSEKYALIVLNFANMDMVGHTGVLKAAIQACEVVDRCVQKIVTELNSRHGITLITADHGNAEKMTDEKGQAHTAHTTHPVPFVLVTPSGRKDRLHRGILADIAPTILHLMGIEKPKQMTGNSLIDI
jgi:2,3-bisphosphoglycerate-independent phosphoglycerate mutase